MCTLYIRAAYLLSILTYLISKLRVYIRCARPTKTTTFTLFNQLYFNQLTLNWLLKKAEWPLRLIRTNLAILQVFAKPQAYIISLNRYYGRVFKDAPPDKNIGP